MANPANDKPPLTCVTHLTGAQLMSKSTAEFLTEIQPFTTKFQAGIVDAAELHDFLSGKNIPDPSPLMVIDCRSSRFSLIPAPK